MRRLVIALSAFAVAASLLPAAAFSQTTRQEREEQQKRDAEKAKADKEKQRKKDEKGPAALGERRAEGPCPYVKVLYDAARDVEFKDNKAASASVAYTGEIEGVKSDCAYKSDEPIVVQMNILFALGKGPQATGSAKTYRYWVAVTERNKTVLAKEYFDLPITFPSGTDRVYANEPVSQIVIPRTDATVNGNNFEVLVGFDVTAEQAEFNREGKRFRVNAGQTAQTGAPSQK